MYDRDRDRDRDRERERDRDRSDRDRGDAYRPRRSPPRDPYPGGRSAADTYTPASQRGGFRDDRGSARGDREGLRDDRAPGRASRRSRSPSVPPFRRRSPPRENNWRASDRDRRLSPPRDRRSSPPRDSRRGSPSSLSRRGYSPRRDGERGRYRDDDGRGGRYRSPLRDERSGRDHRDSRDMRDTRDRFARSPPRRERTRSPPYPKRPREYSPVPRDRPRSPPPKRERIASPRRYDSPPRRPRSPPSGPRANREFARRDRSRSPRRDDRRAQSKQRDHIEHSAPISTATSRRSSPPVHPDRMPRLEPEDRAIKQIARSPFDSPARSPALKPELSRDIDNTRDRDPDRASDTREAPPTGPSDTTRAPPSGPASSRVTSGRFSPPSGPASSSSRFNNPILAAPSRPRGGRGGFGSSYRGDFGAPSPRRGDFGPSSTSRGGYTPSFRTSSSSSTYPRSQRFDSSTNGTTSQSSVVSKYLGDLPTIIPGGQRLPPKDPAADLRIKRLEEEAEKLRAQIVDKTRTSRNGVREWRLLSRESEMARVRGDLAEENLRVMNGEEGGTSF